MRKDIIAKKRTKKNNVRSCYKNSSPEEEKWKV